MFNNRTQRIRHESNPKRCGKPKADIKTLSKPLKIDGLFQCSTCNKRYKDMSSFSRHKNDCKANFTKQTCQPRHACIVYTVKSIYFRKSSPDNSNIHLKTHQDKQVRVCPSCSKRYVRKDHYASICLDVV